MGPCGSDNSMSITYTLKRTFSKKKKELFQSENPMAVPGCLCAASALLAFMIMFKCSQIETSQEWVFSFVFLMVGMYPLKMIFQL